MRSALAPTLLIASLLTLPAAPAFATSSASTFVGGAALDWGFEIKFDGKRSVFAAGRTDSADYPTTAEAFDSTHNGGPDAFITKLTSKLTDVRASTFLGGSGFDRAVAIAFDDDGNVFVAGSTSSANFPTTSGAFDTSYNGVRDVFIAKLNGNLTNLIASTFLGGSGREEGIDLALDQDGNVLVVGTTLSSNYPTTPGAFDTTRNGTFDAFVAKLDGDLTTLSASTLLGGTDAVTGIVISEIAFAVAVDDSDDVFVTGTTQASDYPTTSGAFDESHNGGAPDPFAGNAGVDLFISKLDGELTTLLASTFVGGSGNDSGGRFGKIALDGDVVWVSSHSASADYPTTASAYDTTFNGTAGSYDGVVSKFDSELTTLLASTFIGGTQDEDATALALGDEAGAFVGGPTGSSDFPTTAGAFDTTYNGNEDAFVAQFDDDLTTLVSSTFLGGTGGEDLQNVAVNPEGDVFATGLTESSDFPSTSTAFDTTYNGGADMFVALLPSAD